MAAVYSNTLAQIRQWVAAKLDDLILCTVTSGTKTTAVLATTDPPLYRNVDDDYFNKHHYNAYCYEGTNKGTTHDCTDWDNSSNHSLTLDPGGSSNFDTTSKLELHRLFTATQYMNAINEAIESVAECYFGDVIDNTSITLEETTDNAGNTLYIYEYDLPTSLLHIYRVIREDYESGKKLTGTVSDAFTLAEIVNLSPSGASGTLRYGPSGSTYILIGDVDGTPAVGDTATGATSGETCSSITAVEDETVGNGEFDKHGEVDLRDWDIIKPSTAQIKFDEHYFSVIGDLRIQLEGYGSQAKVDSDTDVINIPPDWLVWAAIAHLPYSGIDSEHLAYTFARAIEIEADKPHTTLDPASKAVI
jgi:hypothetical protein